ncbi:ricin-type beta-trefoil lectin domain protein [Streptomyces sp. NPDC018000]|uniref:ricin-type beta-trefoil lectin domain protein n=1 Tax=Streptomyces sp. NPDC018000 TaxID=3365028 RepID=UPI0037977E4E
MPSQGSAHPPPSPGTPGADPGGPRFTDAFARRPAAPRRRLLPEKRVWTTVAGAAVVTAVVALAVPVVGRVTFVANEPAAHVAAADAAPRPSPTGATPAQPAQPAPGGSGAPSGAAAPDAPRAQGAPVPAALPAASKAPGGNGTQASGTSAHPKPRQTQPQQSQQPTKKVASDPAPAGSMIVGTGSNRCIDIPGGNPLDGLQLQIHDCDGRAPQRWEFRGDGTVRAMGLCMDVAWGSRNDGAAIQLAHCSGNPAQRFVMSGAGDLVNPQADKCVEVKDRSTGDGAKLQLWTCSGTSNQKWRLA